MNECIQIVMPKACNVWRDPSPQLSTGATQKRRSGECETWQAIGGVGCGRSQLETELLISTTNVFSSTNRWQFNDTYINLSFDAFRQAKPQIR